MHFHTTIYSNIIWTNALASSLLFLWFNPHKGMCKTQEGVRTAAGISLCSTALGIACYLIALRIPVAEKQASKSVLDQ
jgi:hypothetical protein